MKFITAVFVIGILNCRALAGKVEEKTKLLEHLLDNYEEDAEPDNPEVKFNLGLLCAVYDHEDKELETSAWERYAWQDSRLTWNPTDYGGVDILRISSDKIWVPDFKLYNSVAHEDKRQKSKCVVKHDGHVIWVPAVRYKSLCNVNNSSYDCYYKLGSWTEDSSIVSLTIWEDVPVLSPYLNHTCPLLPTVRSEGVVNLHYPCCDEPYSSLKIEVTYRKNPEVYHSHRHGHSHGHSHGSRHGGHV